MIACDVYRSVAIGRFAQLASSLSFDRCGHLARSTGALRVALQTKPALATVYGTHLEMLFREFMGVHVAFPWRQGIRFYSSRTVAN